MNSIISTISIAAAITPPQISWVPAPEIQVWSTRAAFVILMIWLGFILMQFALPSKRGGGGLGRGGGAKFIGTAALIVVLMDLKFVPTIINNALNILWFAFDMVGIHP